MALQPLDFNSEDTGRQPQGCQVFCVCITTAPAIILPFLVIPEASSKVMWRQNIPKPCQQCREVSPVTSFTGKSGSLWLIRGRRLHCPKSCRMQVNPGKDHSRLDTAWSNLSQWKASLPMAGGGTESALRSIPNQTIP